MIFAHLIVGAMPVDEAQFSWFWFVGSIIPDIDHVLVLAHRRIFAWDKIVDSLRHEEQYGIRFKTKYFHSLFGALIVSALVTFFNLTGGIYFFLAYLFHLLLDWPDRDVKQYLYPFKKEFRGFLPIFSKTEQALTGILFLLMLLLYRF